LYGEDILKAMTEKQSEWFPPDFEAEVNGDTEDDDDRLGKWFYMATLSWVVRTYRRSLGPESYFCVYCSVQAHSNASIVSTTHSSIFNDALIDTGSPALALQAYLTTALRTAYYSWLPLFDAKANATTISYVDRLAPVSWRGYWIVMGMISTHITVCGITAFFFLTRTKFSLLGNIWAAFAQVTHTKQAQLVLQDATMRTDKEVAQVLMGIGGMRRRYRTISMSNGEGVRLAPTSKLDSDE
jgi:hypothetical protein